MWTCWNDLGLNLCIVSSTSCMVAISENGLVRSCKESVVATMSNDSTSNKSHRRISSGEYKLCNSQENSTGNHNSILPTIYINYPWSMLQLRICCAFYPNIHALSSCLLLIYLMFYYLSTIHLL